MQQHYCIHMYSSSFANNFIIQDAILLKTKTELPCVPHLHTKHQETVSVWSFRLAGIGKCGFLRCSLYKLNIQETYNVYFMDGSAQTIQQSQCILTSSLPDLALTLLHYASSIADTRASTYKSQVWLELEDIPGSLAFQANAVPLHQDSSSGEE